MANSNFIRLCGWGMVLAAICWLVSVLPGPEEILAGVFPLGIALITLGLAGMYARYGHAAGAIARLALGVGIVGGIAGFITYILMKMGMIEGRFVTNVFIAVMFGGLLVFGIIALARKPMPRGNWLPALAGVWWVLLVISAYALAPFAEAGPGVPLWMAIGRFGVMCLFIGALGYVLQADASKAHDDRQRVQGGLRNVRG